MELLTTRSSLTPRTGTRGRQRYRPINRDKARPERRDLLFITCAAIPLDATTRKASIGSLPPGEIVTRCVAGSYGWGLKASIPLSSLGKRPTILGELRVERDLRTAGVDEESDLVTAIDAYTDQGQRIGLEEFHARELTIALHP